MIPTGVLTEDDVQRGVYITLNTMLSLFCTLDRQPDCVTLSVLDIDTDVKIRTFKTSFEGRTDTIARITGLGEQCVLMKRRRWMGVFSLRRGKLLDKRHLDESYYRNSFRFISKNVDSRPIWVIKNPNMDNKIQLLPLNSSLSVGPTFQGLECPMNTAIHYSDYFGQIWVGGDTAKQQKLSVCYLERSEMLPVKIDWLYGNLMYFQFCPVLEETKQLLCTTGTHIYMYDMQSHSRICELDVQDRSRRHCYYLGRNRCMYLHRDGHAIVSAELKGVAIYDSRKFGNVVARLNDANLYVNQCNGLGKISNHKFAYVMGPRPQYGMKHNVVVFNPLTHKIEKRLLVGNKWTSIEGICSYPSVLKRALQDDEEERIQYILMLRKNSWLLLCEGGRTLVAILYSLVCRY